MIVFLSKGLHFRGVSAVRRVVIIQVIQVVKYRKLERYNKSFMNI